MARKSLLYVVIPAFLVLTGLVRAEDSKVCVGYVSQAVFTESAKDPNAAAVDAGKGLIFELSATSTKDPIPGPAIGRRVLSVIDLGQKVHVLPESFYVSFSCIEKGLSTYWIVEEYTGGMHCCNRYHFLSRSSPDRPIRYMGATGGTMNPRENPWACKGKDLYFEDSDIRFVYFHVAYAFSRLYIPRFYRLTPSSLTVENRPFRDVYRDEIAELNLEIGEKAEARSLKPQSILSEREGRPLSDELGQLVVQKAILYLFAREPQKAWGTLLKDVQSHYRTTEGVALLRKEIEKLLKEEPY